MKTLRRIRAVSLALLAGIGTPVLVWVGAGTALWSIFSEWRATRGWLASAQLACSVDVPCPPGYICADGRCVLQVRQ